MTRKEGMYFALGKLDERIENGMGWKSVSLSDIFGEDDFKDYRLGQLEKEIVLFKGKVSDDERRLVEINEKFDIEHIVQVLQKCLAWDMKDNKDSITKD